ncbi:MAG TPA: hypothetical protein V6D09_02980 [Leptolyngbyaceae cyanobacterium]
MKLKIDKITLVSSLFFICNLSSAFASERWYSVDLASSHIDLDSFRKVRPNIYQYKERRNLMAGSKSVEVRSVQRINCVDRTIAEVSTVVQLSKKGRYTVIESLWSDFDREDDATKYLGLAVCNYIAKVKGNFIPLEKDWYKKDEDSYFLLP